MSSTFSGIFLPTMKNYAFIWTFTRPYCSSCFQSIIKNKKSKLPKPVLDMKDFQSNFEAIKDEMRMRKQEINSAKLESFMKKLSSSETSHSLESIAIALPNRIHPAVKDITGDFRVIKIVGEQNQYSFKPLSGTQILEGKDLLFMSGLNNLCGERSYYFIFDAAVLEQALIDYTVEKLLSKNFTLLTVPDILCEDIIERCGMSTTGERNHVYKLDSDLYGNGWCLSGTSEIGIAAYLMNSNFEKESLPKLYAAVSRCYRAEMSSTAKEKGIYRVHQFTKVEMFGVCLPDESDTLLESFRDLQEELFSSYGLHYRVLDMAAHELGNQAYRKFDVEAWMPGSNRYGELSSCSSCSDYQSRRLNIKCGETFLHTINGTACAVPRTICAICEAHQNEKGHVLIPQVLQPYTKIEVLGLKRGPSYHKAKSFRNVSKNKFKS